MSTQAQPKSTAVAERVDFERTTGMEIATVGGGSSLVVRDMTQVLEFAKIMSKAGVAVRGHLRNNSGACLSVAMQAFRWGMDPFAVGNKSYVVNDQLAYESQLLAAVVNTRAPLERRPTVEFEGKDNNLRCIITGHIKGDPEPRVYRSPPLGGITTKNSPLWKSDPEQQLYYFAIRAWARRHVPEVLLGVYGEDEVDEMTREAARHQGPERAKDVTPARPSTAADLEETEGEIETGAEDGFDLIGPEGEVIGTYTAGAWTAEFQNAMQNAPMSLADRAQMIENNEDAARAIEQAEPGIDNFSAVRFLEEARQAYLTEPEKEPEAEPSAGPTETQVNDYFKQLVQAIQSAESEEELNAVKTNADKDLLQKMTDVQRSDLSALSFERRKEIGGGF